MSSRLAPVAKTAWNRRLARHLLNRAGFGIPLDQVEELSDHSLDQAVERFVAVDQLADDLPEPDFLPDYTGAAMMRQEMRDQDRESRQEMRQEMRRTERRAVEQLKGWWLARMQRTHRPLQEKMALFWHGHFATSAQKVRSAHANYHLNRVFRTHALGDFKQLVLAVGRSPAMLRYLDNMQNRKGRPNENWARELMELFTMGIGNYTEQDIKEAARAFTGWTQRGGQFLFNRRQHDFGEKTFLGKTGAFGGEAIVDIIFQQEATARFIGTKLWEFLAYEGPDEELVDELAERFRSHKYQLQPLLRDIFLSQEFYSERALASQVKSPVQLMLGLLDGLQLTPRRPELMRLALRSMGQDLFYPPNVKGWPGNRAWINTNRLLIRYNITAYLINGNLPNRDRKVRNPDFDPVPFFDALGGETAGQVVDRLLERFLVRPADAEQRQTLVQVLDRQGREDAPFAAESAPESRLRGIVHLVLSMAEFQLC